MKQFRNEIKAILQKLLESDGRVFSAWEGGSAATGYLDEFSDLDLALICSDDAVEDIFEKLENCLREHYGIKHKFRVPEPCWHGHSQVFIELEHSTPFFFVDILIEKKSSDNRFLESDRHGNAVVWFDKQKLIDTTPTPEEEIQKKSKRIYEISKQAFRFIELDLAKLIERGNTINAMDTYHNMLRRLAMILNVKYRPAKYDFGFRYGNRDYPESIATIMNDLLYVKNLDDLKKKSICAIDLFHQTMKELKELENR